MHLNFAAFGHHPLSYFHFDFLPSFRPPFLFVNFHLNIPHYFVTFCLTFTSISFATFSLIFTLLYLSPAFISLSFLPKPPLLSPIFVTLFILLPSSPFSPLLSFSSSFTLFLIPISTSSFPRHLLPYFHSLPPSCITLSPIFTPSLPSVSLFLLFSLPPSLLCHPLPYFHSLLPPLAPQSPPRAEILPPPQLPRGAPREGPHEHPGLGGPEDTRVLRGESVLSGVIYFEVCIQFNFDMA